MENPDKEKEGAWIAPPFPPERVECACVLSLELFPNAEVTGFLALDLDRITRPGGTAAKPCD